MAKGIPITIAGITYRSFTEAEQKLGITPGVALSRVREKGWTLEEAFGLHPCPVQKNERIESRPITVDGITYESEAEAARAHGLKRHTVSKRLRKGIPVEVAFELEGSGYQPQTKKVTVAGVCYPSKVAAANAHGVVPAVFHNRIANLGWTLEQALEIEPPPNGEQKVLGRIYLVSHTASGKKYVGLSMSSLKKRWQEHVKKAYRKIQHHPDSLQAAILLYGADAFTISEVAIGHTRAELVQLERDYIEEYRTTAPHGFNLALGGAGIHSHSKGRAITVNGVAYTSVAQACRVLGKSLNSIGHWLRKGLTPDEAFSRQQGTTSPLSVTFRGITYRSGSELAKAFGVRPGVFNYRRLAGATLEQCLGLVSRTSPNAISIDGKEYQSIKHAAKAYGISYETVQGRRRAGWSLEDALRTPAGKGTPNPVMLEGLRYACQPDAAQAFGLAA
jgi:hypothetical protein